MIHIQCCDDPLRPELPVLVDEVDHIRVGLLTQNFEKDVMAISDLLKLKFLDFI